MRIVLGDGRVPEDVVNPIGTATRIASLIPNAQRTTLEGQTHQVEAEAVAPC